MHILVINDDGPPSVQNSPYVYPLVRALRAAGHRVSVCLPAAERSWIGKAHFIGETVTPTYYRPGPGLYGADGKTVDAPGPGSTSTLATEGVQDPADDEWVLVNGTPASCAQLGLFQLFKHRPPIDLVVSGPNFGRNATGIYALSSGTLGGAMEAAVCNVRAVALSFAYDQPRKDDPEVITAAAKHGARLVEHLYANWGKDVELYTVNIPVRPNIEHEKVVVTSMMQNRWGPGESCFQPVDNPGTIKNAAREDKARREGQGTQTDETPSEAYKHQAYAWKPDHRGLRDGMAKGDKDTDGYALAQGYTSITPMRAAFWEVPAHPMGEMTLPSSSSTTTPGLAHTLPTSPKLLACIDYEDPYVHPLILDALAECLPPECYSLLKSPLPEHAIPPMPAPYLQITPYETLLHESLLLYPNKYIANAYVIRKALIRKHHLAATVAAHRSKHPDDPLGSHLPLTLAFELDYVEFLDEALVECYELHEAWSRNADKPPAEREWWILKPGMSDQGQGIRLFSTEEELRSIFEEWEEANPDSEGEADEEDDDDNDNDGDGDGESASQNAAKPLLAREDADAGLIASQLRHFIVQPYIAPFLFPAGAGDGAAPHAGRKFHLRTYVLAVGALRVYVHDEPLALFAAQPYVAPGASSSASSSTGIDMRAHLTNTCLQTASAPSTAAGAASAAAPGSPPSKATHDGPVALLSTLPFPAAHLASLQTTIRTCTASLFRAAAATPAHFQPLPNAFELFGVDWLVDQHGKAWLLEVNAFPDFGQSGTVGWEVVRDVWRGAMGVVLGERGIVGLETGIVRGGHGGFVEVLDLDMGRR